MDILTNVYSIRKLQANVNRVELNTVNNLLTIS